ncbi:cysteine desulfurase family protein, partial [Nocardioides sp.]|uniref:cysteine desulfurase family protein n=1 Tax=Nocardioides sp. TaxID=35761 RepID=UPI003564C4B2
MYLDTASSEPLHPAAREAMLAALDQGYADPRRLHHEARAARLILDNAREAVAEALGVRRSEVSFTSSGTDAVHRGLLGLVNRAQGRDVVVHSAVEHSAVLHAVAWGADSEEVGVSPEGRVDLEDLLARAAGPGVGAIALQSANHEVGTLQPVGEFESPNQVPLFVDACASMGRLPLPTGWSTAAGSAHKWGGPAGVGVLLVRDGARWRNPFPADDRVDHRGSGFENIPAALGAAAALQAVVAGREERNARQHHLIDLLRAGVATIPDAEVVGDPVGRLPHLATFSFLYVPGEALVDALA